MTSPILPPLSAPPPANLLLFSSQQWSWLTATLSAIYNAHEAELAVLGAIVNSQESLLMTLDDLNTSQDRSEAATSAALAGISREIQQVKDAVAALGSAPTAEEVAAFKARVDANTSRLETAVADLAADDPATQPSGPA